MIYQISKSHNLRLLFSDHCDDATLDLFLKLLKAHPVPELPKIKVKCSMLQIAMLIFCIFRLSITPWIVVYVLLVNQHPYLGFHSLEICLLTLTI